jgi:hypothetical protein
MITNLLQLAMIRQLAKTKVGLGYRRKIWTTLSKKFSMLQSNLAFSMLPLLAEATAYEHFSLQSSLI